MSARPKPQSKPSPKSYNTMEIIARRLLGNLESQQLADFQQSQLRHGVAFAAEVFSLQNSLGPQKTR